MADLDRPHPFASERIGFFSTSYMSGGKNTVIVLARRYQSLPDDQYLDDPRSGARINSLAIRESLQRILDQRSGQLHVHLHGHRGEPRPSFMDLEELPPLVRSMASVDPAQAHGGLILSHDSAFGSLWLPNQSRPRPTTGISIVGFPFRFLI